jgi:hypothetical protein
MHDQRTCCALMRSTDCQRPPQPPTTHAQRSTTLPLQRSGNARVHAAQRDAHTRAINRGNNPTQRCAVTQQPRRSAVQRRTRHTTNRQSQYCGTAPKPMRSRQRRHCTPKTRITHRAYDTATILHILAGPMHTRPTRAPRYHTPRTRTHRLTHDAASPTHRNGTFAS